jgi:hypothetical protein
MPRADEEPGDDRWTPDRRRGSSLAVRLFLFVAGGKAFAAARVRGLIFA